MRALISVSDKTGIVEFAKELTKMGWDIISTGGTSKALKEANIKVSDVSDVTEFPEMLDGRVKTLHPKIHGGLLALRENKEHMATVKKHDIELIDMVVINLYPFEATIKKPGVTLEEAIENIDIGGPSMLRSAAKNHQSVAVIVNPAKYSLIIEQLKKGDITMQTKQDLAVEVFEHTAKYDALIYNYLRKNICSAPQTSSNVEVISLEKIQELRYGENPHQKAAYYKEPNGKGIVEAVQLQGKELSFNNIIDLDSAYNISREFEQPACVIIKHTNPCGTAIGENILEAYKKAYHADSLSAFGGIIGCNREIDKATALEISKVFFEAVVAPSYSADALKILEEKKNLRLLKKDNYNCQLTDYDYKKVTGGFLIQDRDSVNVNKDHLTCPTENKPDDKLIGDLLFAWKICKHVKSNAIVLAKDGVSIGVGAGQMSRVDSVEIAIKKAGKNAKGAVLASDAFFPFRDSIDAANKAGIIGFIQPGGSIRDEESIEACNEHELPMVFTGIRHFKH